MQILDTTHCLRSTNQQILNHLSGITRLHDRSKTFTCLIGAYAAGRSPHSRIETSNFDQSSPMSITQNDISPKSTLELVQAYRNDAPSPIHSAAQTPISDDLRLTALHALDPNLDYYGEICEESITSCLEVAYRQTRRERLLPSEG